MRQQFVVAATLFILAGAGTSLAADGARLKLTLIDPQSPATSMFTVEGWPSFLFMPGAPALVSYRPSGSAPSLSGGSAPATTGDIDCSDLSAPVPVSDADPNRLDADNDGIGCE